MRAAAGARRGGSSCVVEPLGLTLTKTDELVVANAGDDSVLMYDVQGRLSRRIDQRRLLQPTTRSIHGRGDDGDSKDDHPTASAAATEPDVKYRPIPFVLSV